VTTFLSKKTRTTFTIRVWRLLFWQIIKASPNIKI